MSITIVFLSCLAFGAIAVPKEAWFRRLWDRLFPKHIAAPPLIRSESGWTLIQCDDHEEFEAWLDKDEQGLPQKPGEEPSLGSHLLVELYGCEARYLEHERSVGNAMREAAIESDATVVAESFHEFKPFGVSGAVIIQESHYTIHTWPEHGYAAVDLFYCGGTVKVHKAVEVLRDRFRPSRIKFLVVRRGLRSEVVR